MDEVRNLRNQKRLCNSNGMLLKPRQISEEKRISFDEARTVFADHAALIHFDEQHSVDEQREIIIGHSRLNRVLVVSFTERAAGSIRIISARKATKNERQDYEENA